MKQYHPPYEEFIFEDYAFDAPTMTVRFIYSFDGKRRFEEKVTFAETNRPVNNELLDRALRLAFLVAGTSYYKLFPCRKVRFKKSGLDDWAADFAYQIYLHGMSQFLYENELFPDVIASFTPEGTLLESVACDSKGTIAMQSGGKDSLLASALLEKAGTTYTPVYMKYGATYPAVLDSLGSPVRTFYRHLDREALMRAQREGGLNGHVPITYIVLSFVLIDAILHGENTILVSIGAEGDEPHGYIGDLPVNHQWAKSWKAEQLFAEYVRRYISPDIKVGSPLRQYTELRIAELFASEAWSRFGHDFSSCNLANYKQGGNNRQLKWDGTCPKCANSFLLFAPFIAPEELASVIGGNLFKKPGLQDTFKGLFGIEGFEKPLECVGETEELRLAYHMARAQWGEDVCSLPFEVPASNFDYKKVHDMQSWASRYAVRI